MGLDIVLDWYYEVLDFFTDIDIGFLSDIGDSITDLLNFDGLGGDVNQVALALSIGTGGMMAYFWLLDPADMGMNNIPLYMRLSAIIIATIAGYFMASKMTEG